jgi:hypothetical protein
MLFTAEIAEIAKEFTAEDAETAEGSEVDVGRLGRPLGEWGGRR